MRYILITLIVIGCKKSNPKLEEAPFSFTGLWEYNKKGYAFEDSPILELVDGIGCNSQINFTFRDTEFEISLFDGSSCENKYYYVLSYDLSQMNDTTYVLTSDRLIRTNYQPSDDSGFRDIPIENGHVELIVRSTDEFVTYLAPPEDPVYKGRIYKSSFIQYRRNQN